MKKIFILTAILGTISFSHSGRTDSSGGHNCSAKSQSKGLCSGYHYHDGSSGKSTKVSNNSETNKNDDMKEIQKLLKNGGYYNGKIDGIYGSGTATAAKKYLSDTSYNNARLDTLLKNRGIR